MRRPDGGRVTALALSAGAFVCMLLAAVLVPTTASAFSAVVGNSANTAVSKGTFQCADVAAGARRRSTAYFEYAFQEAASATIARDASDAGDSGTYEGSNAKDTGSPRACPADAGSPYRLDGSTSRVTTSIAYPAIRQNFSVEVWFKTTGTGMKILGFEQNQGAGSDHYDKQFYVDNGGYLRYGIYDGNTNTITSPNPVNDGVWHHAVGTTSGSDGSLLYLDGVQVGSDPSKTTAEDFAGYWRIGEGRTQSWPSAPDYSWFNGSLAFAAAYPFVLSPAEIRAEYAIGKPGPTVGPSASTTPQPSASASSIPAATASAAPVASDSPAPAPSASATAVSPKNPQQTAQPVPGSPDISTAQDTAASS